VPSTPPKAKFFSISVRAPRFTTASLFGLPPCSSHGFALNVGSPSLLPAYDAIVPCGIQEPGHGVTSIVQEFQEEGVEQPGEKQLSESWEPDRTGPIPGTAWASCSPHVRETVGGVGEDCGALPSGNSRLKAAFTPNMAGVADALKKDFAEHFGFVIS